MTATPQPKRILGFSYLEIGILTVLLCVGCLIVGAIFTTFLRRNLPLSEPQAPQQKSRPNYEQMLEANGFAYTMSDNDGNPSYTSPCGAIAAVKSDAVGFVARYDPDNNCASKDLGKIISIMYPPEVFDFVFTTGYSLKEFDQVSTGTAVGYKISVSITEYERTLVIIIRDPS